MAEILTSLHGRKVGLSVDGFVVAPDGGFAGKAFTVATVPAAASYTGAIIYVSNGNAGSPCLAVSNGTNWLRIALGAAVAAA